MSYEQKIAYLMTGMGQPSALMTDAYKFSMAQAGFPLRRETFVLTFRRGGPFYNPFDLAEIVRSLTPTMVSTKEAGFLAANGYSLNTAMEHALSLSKDLEIWAAPQGTWFAAGTPVLTVTGPSFLVSWLEPFLIMLNYPIQIATAIKHRVKDFPTVCCDERQIVWLVAGEMQENVSCLNEEPNYLSQVRDNALAVRKALGGKDHRAFEVGLRAATCMQQHLMVLEVCREVGIFKTSNVFGAWKLYMTPVGTTGHEHQMRWGGKEQDDRQGYRAIRDMRPGPPSYLFDTVNPITQGIPAALEVMKESPEHPCILRFDSGDQDQQFLNIKDGCGTDLFPTLIFEDGYTAEKTTKNEAFCDMHKWPREKRLYGYGSFLVSQPHPSPYNRDAISAAYKLSCTDGKAVMKFSGSPGKKSIPGKPQVKHLVATEIKGIVHVIIQEGEVFGTGYTDPQPTDFVPDKITVLISEQTRKLLENLWTSEASREGT